MLSIKQSGSLRILDHSVRYQRRNHETNFTRRTQSPRGGAWHLVVGLREAELRPVFDYAMSKGLTLWDTATVYASGASEKILGEFVKDRADAIISTKFTPMLAQGRGDEAMEEFLRGSLKTLHKDAIDIYWIPQH